MHGSLPGLTFKLLARTLASSFFMGWMLSVASLITLAAVQPARAALEAKATAARKAADVAVAQRATNWRSRQGLYFKRNWGVELIGVHPVSSGYMLTLRYRILDAEKAKVLNDRNTKAYLIDEATGIVLAVPALENIGELRPGSTPQVGRNYFMVFGNPGKVVKVGNTVSLVAGNFRADGIVVD